MSTCSISKCDKLAMKRGWCSTHYMRWYRTGDPQTVRRVTVRPIGYRYVRTDGYVVVKVEPGFDGYQLEHRIMAEKMLGRVLTPDEHVHHVNGDRQDNRPENLLVLTNAEHQKLHDWAITHHSRVEKVCERCGAIYLRKKSRAASSRFCSNKCRLEALHEGNRRY